ncbi:hypothetical protein Poly21_37110 [Allorhodopirellula heiligendammensis]|uniref:Uncharacterized protein n=1 Tax=Allorhodopirellula heiligendammensis TaxID=2714739 RepID=A0A5C6BYZ3_9BACT|nr:hypothetical protein Poly21_37110 [Allorhodopirellula heiligendammensis]|tara:strand:- start:598 stop:744 length:147 start_codon:yes stop_codon:yes gene_type:complete
MGKANDYLRDRSDDHAAIQQLIPEWFELAPTFVITALLANLVCPSRDG